MIDPVRGVKVSDGVLHVSLGGAIVFTNAEDVRDRLRDEVERATPRRVRLDLADVTFLDSSGVAVLVMVRRAAQRVGADCLIDHAGPGVREHLRLAGLTHLFGIRRTRTEGR